MEKAQALVDTRQTILSGGIENRWLSVDKVELSKLFQGEPHVEHTEAWINVAGSAESRNERAGELEAADRRSSGPTCFSKS